MKNILMSLLLLLMANTVVLAEEDIDPFEDMNRVIYILMKQLMIICLSLFLERIKNMHLEFYKVELVISLVICVMCLHWLIKYYNSNPLKV